MSEFPFSSWLGRLARAIRRRRSAESLGETHKPRMGAAPFVILALACVAGAQTTAPLDKKLDFGAEGLFFPPATIVNAHVPRTAQLLGDAYRRNEPLEWRRVQLVGEIGEVALPAGAPYLVHATKDQSPAVRAEAARSAGMTEKPPTSLLAAVEALLADVDVNVRREAVLSAAALARALNQSTAAIERGLADAQPPVIAAALQRASTPAHAKAIAQKLPSLAASLRADAADALARLKSAEHAPALIPLLTADVAQRAAALRALGEMKNITVYDAVLKLLEDPHPTVRREAVTAMGKIDAGFARKPFAIEMLRDPDLTVRQAAVGVLTPVPSTDALSTIAAQLAENYAPLHAAARAALIRPGDDGLRQATIALAGEMLRHPDPRRREDASYVLGRLRSGHAFDEHLALLAWDLSAKSDTDWPLVAQAAESLGLIGNPRAAERLMKPLEGLPDTLAGIPPKRLLLIGQAMGNALVAVGRLGHRPALDEAIRLIQIEATEGVPAPVRAAAAFVVGTLGDDGAVPAGVDFLAIYGSVEETRQTKFEALKALGNLRYAPLAGQLKTIAETNLTPDLRWIAHWSYQRAENTRAPFTPAIDRREPPVSISDLP